MVRPYVLASNFFDDIRPREREVARHLELVTNTFPKHRDNQGSIWRQLVMLDLRGAGLYDDPASILAFANQYGGIRADAIRF